MNWKIVEDDGYPPRDVLVLAKGDGKDHGYAICFNDDHYPNVAMVQVVESPKYVQYIPVPFNIKKWIVL